MLFKETPRAKIVRSKNFNCNFDKKTGYTEVWGKTKEDDPSYAPFPLIADFEISTICYGKCKFCYKGNTPNGQNMSLETFKKILDKLTPLLHQIAFGADSTGTANPEMWDIMDYCLEKGVVPNITLADISDEVADKLAARCGAVAVSVYDYDTCYNSIKKLTDRGMEQVNIHAFLSLQTYEKCLKVIDDMKNDPRLSKMNALVFLSLKKKGRATKGFDQLPQEMFNTLVTKCRETGINYGFDSCGAHKAFEAHKHLENFENIKQAITPCESTRESSYVDVNGDFFPCSFSAGEKGWEEGIDVVNCDDFIKDVWNHPRVIEFRNNLLKNNCNCPIYDI